jgi:hypothetical protein
VEEELVIQSSGGTAGTEVSFVLATITSTGGGGGAGDTSSARQEFLVDQVVGGS